MTTYRAYYIIFDHICYIILTGDSPVQPVGQSQVRFSLQVPLLRHTGQVRAAVICSEQLLPAQRHSPSTHTRPSAQLAAEQSFTLLSQWIPSKPKQRYDHMNNWYYLEKNCDIRISLQSILIPLK